jgi:site-specific recombinase XerD
MDKPKRGVTVPKVSFQTSFRNSHQASYLARDISSWFNRGSALENRIETVLNQLRETTGVRSLKQLDNEKIQAYVSTLRERVDTGELSRKTAENYVSALNRIIEYTNQRLGGNLETFSPRQEGLSRGSFQFVDRAVSQETHERFLNFLSEKQDIRAQALTHSVELQREFGLRLRESLAIKASTIERALETGVLHLTRQDCTKNGREREIPIRNEEQREALERALEFMKENNLFSLCPTEHLREQYNYAYNVAKEFNQEHKENFHYHGERHAFAQEFIKEGVDRQTLSEWLGHGREEITKVYGG